MSMLNHLKKIFAVKHLKNKILMTLALVLVYKLLAIIPVPGVNTEALSSMLADNEGLAFFGALMWWWLASFSIILMGLSPYINALIIMQLLGVIIPPLENLKKEWEAGQRKINKYTRILAFPLAFVQSYWMILLLNTLASGQIIDTSDTGTVLTAMTIVTAGTMFLVWLGEVMTEYGISNGISIIISASVLSGIPSLIAGYFPDNGGWVFDTISWAFTNSEGFAGLSSWLSFLIILALTVAVIYVIVKFTEWYRKIPVIYTRTGREEKSFFPIKVNQAGMVPIIFAVSLITFPSILWKVLSKGNSDSGIAKFLMENFSFNNPSWMYIAVYFVLVVLFAYFYVSITFNTDEIAESIQKRGGYIPGVRPGSETSAYLGKVSSHLNLFGGWFLALIAVFPYIMQKFVWTQVNFIVSWAGLIIIVSVVLELVRQIDSEMQMYDYKKFK